MVLNLCEMFHCMPSEIEEESSEIVRLLNIRSLGTKKQTEE